MKVSLRPLVLGRQLALGAVAARATGVAGNLYVPLSQACRLLDTRVAGSVGPLSSSGGNYFGTTAADIGGVYQGGNPEGCSIPAGAAAGVFLQAGDQISVQVTSSISGLSLTGNQSLTIMGLTQ